MKNLKLILIALLISSCLGSKKLTRGELMVLHEVGKAKQIYVSHECGTDTIYLVGETVWTPGANDWYYRNRIIERKMRRK